MTELNTRDRILLLDEFDEAAQQLDELIVPDAEIAKRAAAAAFYLCGFHDDEACAARGEFAGIHQMPVGRKALHRGILVHRRHHDPVAQFDTAEGQWRKQQDVAHGGPLERFP
jgi:hypothetical protein